MDTICCFESSTTSQTPPSLQYYTWLKNLNMWIDESLYRHYSLFLWWAIAKLI